MKPPIPNSYWVEPGRFLAGEHPSSESAAETEKRLRRIIESGIDCFIDLTQPGECPEYRPLLPAHVRYHNLPLVDHAVPEDPATVRGVMVTLHDALREGRGVYLHCRAGIGRTGLSVGCHLAETGAHPEQAVEVLNQLWQQNARSRYWPHVPETEEQEHFVRHWRARSDAAGDPAVRAEGALVGVAVGDALAQSTQGRLPGGFALVGGPVGDAEQGLPPGAWTDDTAMALCVAESLIAMRGFDARDQMLRYRRWQQEGHLSATGQAVGLRPTVRRVLALAGWRRTALVGSHDPAQLDAEPLVRCIGPALYFQRDFAAAVAAGADTARVTHQAPLVVDACRLFTGMLHRALAGDRRDAILGLATDWPAAELKPELLRLAEGWLQPAPRQTPRRATILTVLDDVVRAFAGSKDFAPGMLELANLGGESDVACAAYGQLAGAVFGLGAIPPAWRAVLPTPGLFRQLAQQLLQGPGDSLQ